MQNKFFSFQLWFLLVMTICIYVNGLIRPHSRYRVGVRFIKQKRIYKIFYISFVDPDLLGSETFHGIRLRIHNLRFWIRIRIQNLRSTLTKSSKEKEIDIYDIWKHIFGSKTRQIVGAGSGSEKMLWIRIRKDPKLFAGSRYGFGTQGYGSGSGSGTELKSYQTSSKLLAIW
jgi:hypothetical protein